MPLCWKKHTVKSRYVDQASLEDVAIDYKDSMFEFGEELNYMPWRILLANNQEEAIKKININNNQLNIGAKSLAFLHTHFHDQRFIQVNNIFINALRKLKRYKELLIIDRIINKNWIIKIPKQPQQGIWRHANDSFRELAMLYKKNNSDVNIELIDSGHCMLGNHILLYDRPTQEWFNQDLVNSSLILLGNANINKEGELLKQNNLNVNTWIFWPRRPLRIEKFLEANKTKLYNERTVESIFIGNIENNVQNQYRNSQYKWENVLNVYYCTQGTQHKFSQEEYLEQLANAKYGLCLRGYGKKCHREVECMAWGTVPIITNEVCISSYINPPKEGVHYMRAHDREDMKRKIAGVRPERWKKMSDACVEWYKENVHSKGSWNTTIKQILYD